MTTLHESRINVVGEGTRIEGKITLDAITRVHGVLIGEVEAREGSTLILAETATVEGTIRADTLIIDGFVEGDVYATTRVEVSRTGRVVGNITAPSVRMEFGCHFEGRCAAGLPIPVSP